MVAVALAAVGTFCMYLGYGATLPPSEPWEQRAGLKLHVVALCCAFAAGVWVK